MATVLPAWKPYRPSNGTEGELFMEAWCARCENDDFLRGGNKGCPIIVAAMCSKSQDDPAHPKEWIRQANDDSWPGTARCTAFVPVKGETE